MPSPYRPKILRRLHRELRDLWESAQAVEREFADDLARLPLSCRPSGANLAHYLAVRRKDIRQTQIELSHLGLSSLGRLESHVLAGIESVLAALQKMSDEPLPALPGKAAAHFKDGDDRLARHTTQLLGPCPRHRAVHIMVTMPSEAAEDYRLVRDLLANGMNVARVNSAHDGPKAWGQMVQNIRRAARAAKRACPILMDLSGPKLRTGTIEPGPKVLHFGPTRDGRGVIVQPARVWVSAGKTPPDTAARVLPVDAAFLAQIRTGDTLRYTDIPGRPRGLEVTETTSTGAWAEDAQASFLEPGLPLNLERHGAIAATGTVGDLPAREGTLTLFEGDTLIVTPETERGREARRDADGRAIRPARIPCTLPEVFRDVKAGERILFDDGKIAGVVRKAGKKAIRVEITRSSPAGVTLRSDKGINLPDTDLDLPALTPADLQTLDFAARHADIIGLSFVRKPSDVELLDEELAKRGAQRLGRVLKIENRQAFEDLPRLLLTALRYPPMGVMVARGDLGVELGFERMAEVQEEILWLCEAAHVPVIWATQVLEGLAKKGLPSRGEVTDAAMGSRAECVMLNKGTYIVKTVKFLDDVLVRMRDHHLKKTSMLRKLKVSEGRWRSEA